MNTWGKIYRWRKNITKFFSIETKVSISKETQRIHEEQSWLGIGQHAALDVGKEPISIAFYLPFRAPSALFFELIDIIKFRK